MLCIAKTTLMRPRAMFAPGDEIELDDAEYLRLRADGAVESAEEHIIRSEAQAKLDAIEREAQEAAANVRARVMPDASAEKPTKKAKPPKRD